MPDRRDTPDPDRVSQSTLATVTRPVVDLLSRPDGPRDRQLLFGDSVTILGQDATHAYIRSEKDRYHGFVDPGSLGPHIIPSHRVTALATHIYTAPDIKSAERVSLSCGSHIRALSDTAEFVETSLGFIPRQHLSPADQPDTDPIKIAEKFLGTPYLWGGNSRAGIDCSGLVQAALLACNIPCPGDSDQQCASLGPHLPPNAAPKRGDLLFWKGHVAFYFDATTLIHANAHHMATVKEPASAAIKRIADTPTGPILAHIRL